MIWKGKPLSRRLVILIRQMQLVVKTPLMGVEPTTFELEVQRASPLRHSGMSPRKFAGKQRQVTGGADGEAPDAVQRVKLKHLE